MRPTANSRLIVLTVVGFSLLCINVAGAQSLQFVGCDSAEKSRIKDRLRWVRTNASAIVDSVATASPAAWQGKSEKRFRQLFRDETLRIECTRAVEQCENTPHTVMWRENAYPAPRRYPLTLCTDLLLESEALTSVLVHHIGHHVLLNQPHLDCVQRCEKPRLSTLLVRATQTLLTNEPFSLEWCLTACAPPQEADAGMSAADTDSGLPPVPSGDTTEAPESGVTPNEGAEGEAQPRKGPLP